MKRYHNSNRTPRTMAVKYAGPCHCCGAQINPGELATYYPPGSLGTGSRGVIAHIGGLEGTGARCTAEIRRQMERNPGFVDLDRMYEDQCAETCGK